MATMPSVVEFIQCDARNYTPGRQGCGVSQIVVHYTTTDASAYNNLLYFSRSDAQASAHYFIDKNARCARVRVRATRLDMRATET